MGKSYVTFDKEQLFYEYFKGFSIGLFQTIASSTRLRQSTSAARWETCSAKSGVTPPYSR